MRKGTIMTSHAANTGEFKTSQGDDLLSWLTCFARANGRTAPLSSALEGEEGTPEGWADEWRYLRVGQTGINSVSEFRDALIRENLCHRIGSRCGSGEKVFGNETLLLFWFTFFGQDNNKKGGVGKTPEGWARGRVSVVLRAAGITSVSDFRDALHQGVGHLNACINRAGYDEDEEYSDETFKKLFEFFFRGAVDAKAFFVYGSLRPDDVTNQPWRDRWLEGRINCFRGEINGTMYDDNYASVVLPKQGECESSSTVQGWIVEYPPSMYEEKLKDADKIENYPTMYGRESVQVRLRGGTVRMAWVYVRPNCNRNKLVPNGDWVAYKSIAAGTAPTQFAQLMVNLANKIVKEIDDGVAKTTYMHRSKDSPHKSRKRLSTESDAASPDHWFYGTQPNGWKGEREPIQVKDFYGKNAWYGSVFGTRSTEHYAHRHNLSLPTSMSSTKRYYVDCAGFIRGLITSIIGEEHPAYAELRQHNHWDRKDDGFPFQSYPRAHVFADFFRRIREGKITSEWWESVNEAEKLLPGDIIAFFPTEQSRREQMTGHIYIVVSPPSGGSYDAVESTSGHGVGSGGGVRKRTFHTSEQNSGDIYGIGRLKPQ